MLNRPGRSPSPFIIPPLFRLAVRLFWCWFFDIQSLSYNEIKCFTARNVRKIFPHLTCCLSDRHFSGIANRAIRPTLGIVDPLHTLHMPERLTANSGYDVLW